MTTAYPAALDTFQNPGAVTMMDEGPGLYHDEQHANINDAVAALQAKVGIDGSAVTSSLDFRTTANAGAIIVVAGDLATHVGGVDPHGDRAYADGVGNAVATYSDGQLAAHVAASDPHGDRAYADAGDGDTLTSAQTYADTGDGSTLSAANAYADAGIAAHLIAADPHGDRAYADSGDATAISTAEGYTDTALGAHVAASDPHGDRAYADAGDATTLSAAEGYADAGDAGTLSSANGFTTSAIATHAAAVDPHGDRAFATSAIATHTAASDPHGDRAYADAAIATHAGAADPHGDRAFATAAIATHNGVTTAHGISAFGATLVDDADASAARATLALGTMATQAATAVAITGGTIDGTVIGGTTKAAGSFTTGIFTDKITVGSASANRSKITGSTDTLELIVSDAGTTNAPVALYLNHTSSAAAGVAFGVEMQFGGRTASGSGSPGTPMASLIATWLDPANATLKSAFQWGVYDVGTLRVGIEMDAIVGGTDLRLIPAGVGTVRIAGAGGYTGSALSVNGIIAHNDTMLMRTFGALANGAGASGGTLTNAPAAGNPTKWLSIDDNGTTRYIPAW